jgi:hypothetical protein
MEISIDITTSDLTLITSGTFMTIDISKELGKIETVATNAGRS